MCNKCALDNHLEIQMSLNKIVSVLQGYHILPALNHWYFGSILPLESIIISNYFVMWTVPAWMSSEVHNEDKHKLAVEIKYVMNFSWFIICKAKFTNWRTTMNFYEFWCSWWFMESRKQRYKGLQEKQLSGRGLLAAQLFGRSGTEPFKPCFIPPMKSHGEQKALLERENGLSWCLVC